jgi:hypothetical protein
LQIKKNIIVMAGRLIFIKYSICALVFASAAAMVHNFPAEPTAAQGRALATQVNDDLSEQLTQDQAVPTTLSKVTIGSL